MLEEFDLLSPPEKLESIEYVQTHPYRCRFLANGKRGTNVARLELDFKQSERPVAKASFVDGSEGLLEAADFSVEVGHLKAVQAGHEQDPRITWMGQPMWGVYRAQFDFGMDGLPAVRLEIAVLPKEQADA